MIIPILRHEKKKPETVSDHNKGCSEQVKKNIDEKNLKIKYHSPMILTYREARIHQSQTLEQWPSSIV
ncbi:hypothetical protein HanXRQr2_Chr11g0468021 [Helianthus annuus]|uniref:Uncharacterized protein n=1 Tax=Helianthus annuus TaxID=4232 RepID=A0A9K3HKV8_HELAN|nr:hypothetical protein HanXRQr2_Chr11g0468021 [Helianthus annuus]